MKFSTTALGNAFQGQKASSARVDGPNAPGAEERSVAPRAAPERECQPIQTSPQLRPINIPIHHFAEEGTTASLRFSRQQRRDLILGKLPPASISSLTELLDLDLPHPRSCSADCQAFCLHPCRVPPHSQWGDGLGPYDPKLMRAQGYPQGA